MMMKQPISLSPEDVKVLIRCPLHYHFLQQKAELPAAFTTQLELDRLVKNAIQALHVAGGPTRLSLEETLWPVIYHPVARQMVEHYYHRLKQDWSRVLAAPESMTLKISISGIPLLLEATVDRLDRTSDGGILALLFRTQAGPVPEMADLRQDPALTIYHALVAATYPLKRPVRLQELWLQSNREITIELSEEEYRHNLKRLREPVRAFSRGEVMARPGLHCEVCPFKHYGCPVYSQEAGAEAPPPDFDSPDSPSKIPPRQWIFKI